MNKDIDTELIMLGTGHAMVTKCYNTCFILKNAEEYFLVDAGGGNGILVQMEKAGIPFTGLHHMFITHAHTDHILGGVWVIRKVASLMHKDNYAGNFTVYGHDKVIHLLQLLCTQMLPGKFTKYIGNRINLTEITNEDNIHVNGMDITFFDIYSQKEKQFGFQAILPKNKKLTCLGDEPCNIDNAEYVQGCDWLLCEAFCMESESDKYDPHEKHHSTALDAGKIAQEFMVKNLLLYHTEDSDLNHREANYKAEAGIFFQGNIFVPRDLDKIIL